MDGNDLIGKVVHSKAGRDMDKYFIVVGILNKEYVYISDGQLRKIEKPKKKKIKHLIFTDTVAEEIRDFILSGKKVSNTKIKKFLQVEHIGEEV